MLATESMASSLQLSVVPNVVPTSPPSPRSNGLMEHQDTIVITDENLSPNTSASSHQLLSAIQLQSTGDGDEPDYLIPTQSASSNPTEESERKSLAPAVGLNLNQQNTSQVVTSQDCSALEAKTSLTSCHTDTSSQSQQAAKIHKTTKPEKVKYGELVVLG